MIDSHNKKTKLLNKLKVKLNKVIILYFVIITYFLFLKIYINR